MKRVRLFSLILAGLLLLPLAWFVAAWALYPSDKTPAGAYLRIVAGVNRGRPEEVFSYLETAAQNGAFTIRDYRRKARERVLAAYPEPERSHLAQAYKAEAIAADGAAVFALHARDRGWLNRLRQDMSRIDHIEIEGDRATVQTIRGTRYPFRRAESGVWGLTLFTATMVAEGNKAARDYGVVQRAAADYERVRQREKAN